MSQNNEDIILEVQNLTKYFDTPKGKLHAVDGVNFKIKKGTTLGIVGESGCGSPLQEEPYLSLPNLLAAGSFSTEKISLTISLAK